MSDDKRTDDFEDRLRAFEHDAGQATPFETVWRRAEAAQSPPAEAHGQRWNWAMAGAAAMVLAILVLPVLEPADTGFGPEQQALLDELASTTRWQAPSDRWLPKPMSVYGLPRLGGGVSLEPPVEE